MSCANYVQATLSKMHFFHRWLDGMRLVQKSSRPLLLPVECGATLAPRLWRTVHSI